MYRLPDAALHQVVGGRWRLLDVLGATEHGTAFRAESVDDGRPYRLELWDPCHVERRGELARFEREARTLGRLRHERCLSVVAFGAHEGQPFLVSDLPEGKSLRDELAGSELTVTRALSLGLQLCEALEHLHRHGLIHRGLHPENVWVARTPAGEALKLGLPRIGPTTERSDAARRRFYRPPERSEARADPRPDLYAAGMLLYVMCTGREPPDEVMAATAGGASVPPPRVVSPERGISERVERVLLRAVAPAPDGRFGTADELVTALQSAGARPATAKRRPAQRPLNRTAMVATAFAAVALLGAGALRGSGRQAPSPSPVEQRPSLTTQAAREGAPPVARLDPPAATPPRPRPEAPAPAVAVIETPAAEPKGAAAPEAAAPVAAAAAATPSHDERSEIWSLLDRGRLDDGAARIKSLVARDPDAAWPRFALGVLYYRRYWRQDSVRQWQLAVAQDPGIRNDPQFGEYLCFMLDDTWKAAGVTDLLKQLRVGAVPLLDHCAASAKTPHLRALAARTLDLLRRTDRRLRR